MRLREEVLRNPVECGELKLRETIILGRETDEFIHRLRTFVLHIRK